MNSNNLLNVSKPARYIGGELNSIIKIDADNLFNFCLIFPDIYEIGSSHVGYKLLYNIINSSDKLQCERFFAPWIDALNKFGSEIFYSLESKKPLKDFDALGFSISYELSYTTILRILKSSDILLYSSERLYDNSPIIMAGGGAVLNPQPISDFIDIFYIGEGDDHINTVLEKISELKNLKKTKEEIFKYLNDTYPFLYIPIIDRDKIIKRDISTTFAKTLVDIKPIVPMMEAVQDRVAVEIARGCTSGCRFCQAGMIYRPVRERPPQMIIDDAMNQLKASGYNEVSLLSLSSGDYSQITPLVHELNKKLADKNISLSTPSLRADSVTKELFEELTRVRKSGFTIAPEAGSERLRRVINKNLTEEDILSSVEVAGNNGISSVKLYFMIGLPTETDEDILDIINLADKIRKRVGKKGFNITISVSHFVPKAHTVFERFGQVSYDELRRKVAILREAVKSTRHRLKYHDIKVSKIEALLSRGDKSVGKLLLALMQSGAYLDAWGDFFDYDKWLKTADDLGLDIFNQSDKFYNKNEQVAWWNIDCGVTENFKSRELEKAITETMIDDCRFGNCFACGVCNYDTIDVINADNDIIINHEMQTNSPEKIYHNYMIIYEKKDTARFLSALELSRLVTHSLIVMGVDLKYSEGFNPSPRLLLLLPLPVGVSGVNEIMLLRSTDISMSDFVARFNLSLPNGLVAKSVKEVSTLKVGTDFISAYKLGDKVAKNFKNLLDENKIFYDRKDKLGGVKRIELMKYFISFENNIVTIKADDTGSFNLIELFKFNGLDYENISVERINLQVINSKILEL